MPSPSVAGAKVCALAMGHVSAAYTTVSKCLPSACLNNALAHTISKFTV